MMMAVGDLSDTATTHHSFFDRVFLASLVRAVSLGARLSRARPSREGNSASHHHYQHRVPYWEEAADDDRLCNGFW